MRRLCAGVALACALPLASARVAAQVVPPGAGRPGAAHAAIVKPDTNGAPWTPDDVAKLQRDIDALLAAAPTLRGAHVGLLAIDTKTGAPLYQRNADDAFRPASTLKLVVGSAALDKLGPDFHFTTSAALTNVSGQTATLPRLVVTAGADPFLMPADLDGLVAAATKAGIGTQAIVQIVSPFASFPPYPDGWTWDDFAYAYAARVTGFILDENQVHLEVAPGRKSGDPAQLKLSDPAVLCRGEAGIGNGTTTVASGDSDLSLTTSAIGGGCLNVLGTIALGAAPEPLDAALANPDQAAKDALVSRLTAAGITVLETKRPGSAVGAQFWSHDSPSLSAFLGPRFWIPSDNLVAEVLLRTLALHARAAPGEAAPGVAFEQTWLHSIGVDPATTTLADGSGMSQYDRITPRDLVTILQYDWNGPNHDLVLDSLPVGGARGTIEGIAGSDAAGRVFAKTGSMMHVRALAGYLATKRHGAVTFDFTVDDWLGDYADLAPLRAQVLSRIVDD